MIKRLREHISPMWRANIRIARDVNRRHIAEQLADGNACLLSENDIGNEHIRTEPSSEEALDVIEARAGEDGMSRTNNEPHHDRKHSGLIVDHHHGRDITPDPSL